MFDCFITIVLVLCFLHALHYYGENAFILKVSNTISINNSMFVTNNISLWLHEMLHVLSVASEMHALQE